jgi:hypothetical protein
VRGQLEASGCPVVQLRSSVHGCNCVVVGDHVRGYRRGPRHSCVRPEDGGREASGSWVSGGDSADLQALIDDTNGASGSDTLNTDAATFNSDASGYLSDNAPYLAVGWQTGFDQVTDDINALAQDCGQLTAPPNTPSSP